MAFIRLEQDSTIKQLNLAQVLLDAKIDSIQRIKD
jgi:hypothetical protein